MFRRKRRVYNPVWMGFDGERMPDGDWLRYEIAWIGDFVYLRGQLINRDRYFGPYSALRSEFLALTPERRRTAVGNVLKRLREQAGQLAPRQGLPDPRVRQSFPNICDLICPDTDEDGKKRQRSKITVSWADGSFKAAMNEFDLGASCIVSGDSLEGLLQALEAKLASIDPEWRLWPKDSSVAARKPRK